MVAFLPAGAHASPAWPAASKIVIRQCMKSSLLWNETGIMRPLQLSHFHGQ